MSGASFVRSASGVDLSARVAASTTVVASPSAAAETIIASVTTPAGLSYASGVLLVGWAAFTVGTSGASAQLRIRQTSVSGTLKADTGALTGGVAATDLLALQVVGFDTGAGDGQVYKLTLQVASGAAASTVSAVTLALIAV